MAEVGAGPAPSLAGEPHSELLPSSSWARLTKGPGHPGRSLERGRGTSPALHCPRPRGHSGNTHISRPGSSQRPPALWHRGGTGLEDVKHQLPGPDSPHPEQETGRTGSRAAVWTQGPAVGPCHALPPPQESWTGVWTPQARQLYLPQLQREPTPGMSPGHKGDGSNQQPRRGSLTPHMGRGESDALPAEPRTRADLSEQPTLSCSGHSNMQEGPAHL